MSDSTSSLLQLILQETGNNDNDWGNILNQQLIKIENAIAGVLTLPISGGTTILTDDQSRNAVITLGGTLTSDAVIQLPARVKTWTIGNITSGNFKVSIKTEAGSPLLLHTSGIGYEQFFCNGTDMFHVGDAGAVKIGQVVDWAGPTTNIPPNYMPCDGRAISRTTYFTLFNTLGATWGAGDGTTTFNIPDARGRYRRGNDGTYAPGTYLAADLQSHTHTASTDVQGSHAHSGSTSSDGDHAHSYTVTSAGGLGIQGGAFSTLIISSQQAQSTSTAGAHTHTVATDSQGAHGHNITVGATGGAETRPNSYVAVPIIRVS